MMQFQHEQKSDEDNVNVNKVVDNSLDNRLTLMGELIGTMTGLVSDLVSDNKKMKRRIHDLEKGLLTTINDIVSNAVTLRLSMIGIPSNVNLIKMKKKEKKMKRVLNIKNRSGGIRKKKSKFVVNKLTHSDMVEALFSSNKKAQFGNLDIRRELKLRWDKVLPATSVSSTLNQLENSKKIKKVKTKAPCTWIYCNNNDEGSIIDF